jgi:modulator of FtsH protease HflK
MYPRIYFYNEAIMVGKNPWGKPTGGMGGGNFGGGKKPEIDLEALLRKSQERMKTVFQNDGNERKMGVLILLGVLVLWLASGIYRVNPDELGVVVRFGEYHRTMGPGLNYHLPYPVETVMIPSVTSINKVEIGARGSFQEDPTVRVSGLMMSAPESAPRQENLMLTGDRNIVDIDFEVQWKIDATAPQDFLFNMRDPSQSVRAVAESAMREVIGRNKLDDVLTSAQSQIADETKQIMQTMFDSYDAGIEIIAVNLSRPDVPGPVINEFQEVKRAEQEKETKETKAEGYRNEILPKAKGEATKMVQDATAYKARVVAEAEGDVARFNKVFAQYNGAKEVTRERMYLEAMEQVLGGMQKVIVDQKKSNFVPFMPINPTAAKPAQ